jgi:hypothetical protein
LAFLAVSWCHRLPGPSDLLLARVAFDVAGGGVAMP